jgi:hypothetical protein
MSVDLSCYVLKYSLHKGRYAAVNQQWGGIGSYDCSEADIDLEPVDALCPRWTVVARTNCFDDAVYLLAKYGGEFAGRLDVEILVLSWGLFAFKDSEPFAVHRLFEAKTGDDRHLFVQQSVSGMLEGFSGINLGRCLDRQRSNQIFDETPVEFLGDELLGEIDSQSLFDQLERIEELVLESDGKEAASAGDLLEYRADFDEAEG